MNDRHDEYVDLCASYALDNLEEEERLRLEEHLASGCPACEAAIADFSVATLRLAQSVPPVKVSRALRDRVMIAARSLRGASPAPSFDGHGRVIEPPARRSAWAVWIPALATAAFAIVAGAMWNEALVLRERLAEERRMTAVLGAPRARIALFEVTPEGAAALRARAVYDPASHSAVLVFDDFRAPSGRDFELWAMRGNEVTSLGVIRTDESGHAMMRIEDAGEPGSLQAFAISLEPRGGSPNPASPSGPVVMVGRLAG